MTEADARGTVIPVVEESATVSTREVETDRVRVRTVTEESSVDVPVRLSRDTLLVERRAVEREVAVAPAPYAEGDTLIVSIVEERPVVERRLFVVEELVIHRVAHVEDVQIPVILKTMRAVIDHKSAQAE